MRKIQIFSIIFFLIAVAGFLGYRVYERKNNDSAGPIITMEERSITVSCSADEQTLLAGVTAVDAKDGDVTGSLMVEALGNFITDGRRNITIAAVDSHGNVSKTTREIIYRDYVSPTFSLSQPLKFALNTSSVLTGVAVWDVLDGDITDNIKLSTEYKVDVTAVGEYPMEFIIANSAGDVESLLMTVEIYNPAEEMLKPQIQLSQYLVYTDRNTDFDPWDYVERITMNGLTYLRGDDGVLWTEEAGVSRSISEADVLIEGEIDKTTPGVYEITYHITSASSLTGSVRLVVVVRD